jgi:shikimate dehydrogenase
MIKARAISGSTRFGGLIGKGISHSLSPLIHNSSAEILGLDAVYLTFDLLKAPEPGFFETMLKANCYGFNVTVPYKESIANIIAVDPIKPLRSVNTLIPRSDHWEGASTDAAGFVAGLLEIDRTFADFSAVILMGYGGAAKALLAKIREDNPATPVYVLKRSAAAFAEREEWKGVSFESFDNEALESLLRTHPNSLLIQCTSAPLRGDDLNRFLPSLPQLKGAFVDLVYGSPSCLLAEAAKQKIPCQDGVPMLIHQALLSQKLWWGQSASFSDMKTAIARQR